MKTLFTLLLLTSLTLGLRAGGNDGGFSGDNSNSEPFLKEFSVFPNPTNGNVTITLKATDITQGLDFKIYNLIGQELYSEDLGPYNGSRQIEFDLSKYPKGIYMIEITNGSESRIKRVSLI